jgi:hypothetical protein
MSRALCLVALVSGLGLLTLDEKLAQPTGDVNFVLGQKWLDPDDWAPVENQSEFAVNGSWGNEAWDIHIATDFSYSRDRGELFDPSIGFPLKITLSTWELSVGYRKIWETRNIRSFIGGGFGLINAKAEGEALGVTVSEDGSSVGPWVAGGVFWRLGSRFNIGIDARYSDAKVKISDVDVEAGGFHGGLILGWGWPASR